VLAAANLLAHRREELPQGVRLVAQSSTSVTSLPPVASTLCRLI
jgi:hypothetical protein